MVSNNIITILKIYCIKFVCFVFGATATSGLGPPHSRGFLITQNDGRTPLDE
jgi:hypothetical protein